jgi:hypothetical protein
MLLQRDAFSCALKTLVTLVPKRSTIPVLENIIIIPTKDGVALTATDLTTEARVVVPANDAFVACLPARQLLEFVSSADRGARARADDRLQYRICGSPMPRDTRYSLVGRGDSIKAASRSRSTGLMTCASKPASRARWRSDSCPKPVSATSVSFGWLPSARNRRASS